MTDNTKKLVKASQEALKQRLASILDGIDFKVTGFKGCQILHGNCIESRHTVDIFLTEKVQLDFCVSYPISHISVINNSGICDNINAIWKELCLKQREIINYAAN